MTRLVLVPGVLALRPEYRSLIDPVAELRAAVAAALTWAAPPPSGHFSSHESGVSVAETTQPRDRNYPINVVVGNGSAKRTEKAPGYFDPRAEAFDESLRSALVASDPEALRAVDDGLAKELWASTESLGELADLLEGARLVSVDYDDAPYGVQYWVIRWER